MYLFVIINYSDTLYTSIVLKNLFDNNVYVDITVEIINSIHFFFTHLENIK